MAAFSADVHDDPLAVDEELTEVAEEERQRLASLVQLTLAGECEIALAADA